MRDDQVLRMMKRLSFAKEQAPTLTALMLCKFSEYNHHVLTDHWGARQPARPIQDKQRILDAIKNKYSLKLHEEDQTVLWYTAKHFSNKPDRISLQPYWNFHNLEDEEADEDDIVAGFKEVCQGLNVDPSGLRADDENDDDDGGEVNEDVAGQARHEDDSDDDDDDDDDEYQEDED
jgi:hypothetical protein